jgi:hypothetical protein
MRQLLFVIAAVAAIFSFESLAPNRAEAMTLPAPAAMADMLGARAESVAYVCRRWCGPYGCRRRCFYTAPRYYRPYYRPYRPYYRPYRYYRYY